MNINWFAKRHYPGKCGKYIKEQADKAIAAGFKVRWDKDTLYFGIEAES